MNSVYSKPKSKNGANGNVLALGFFVKYFIILIIIAKIAQDKKEIKRTEAVCLKPRNRPRQQPSFKSPPPMLLFIKQGTPKNINVISSAKNNERKKCINEKLLLLILILIININLITVINNSDKHILFGIIRFFISKNEPIIIIIMKVRSKNILANNTSLLKFYHCII